MNLSAPFWLWRDHIRVELGDAHALFTTRRGGCCSGPYESLNLGRSTGDVPELVEQNRRHVEKMIGLPMAAIRQVHGTRVRRLTGPTPVEEPLEEADGQLTASREIAPGVLVADCLPIVIAGSRTVVVLHAGWRGLADGVIEEGVGALWQAGDGGALEAAIGPGAGGCCYEVGEEVHERFAPYGGLARRGANLDLGALARAQLEAAGVEAVHDVGLCTICGDPALFFSHRRDAGRTGRQAGIAWLS